MRAHAPYVDRFGMVVVRQRLPRSSPNLLRTRTRRVFLKADLKADRTAKEADPRSSATLEKDTELPAPSASGDARRYIFTEFGRWLTRRCMAEHERAATF